MKCCLLLGLLYWAIDSWAMDTQSQSLICQKSPLFEQTCPSLNYPYEERHRKVRDVYCDLYSIRSVATYYRSQLLVKNVLKDFMCSIDTLLFSCASILQSIDPNFKKHWKLLNPEQAGQHTYIYDLSQRNSVRYMSEFSQYLLTIGEELKFAEESTKLFKDFDNIKNNIPAFEKILFDSLECYCTFFDPLMQSKLTKENFMIDDYFLEVMDAHKDHWTSKGKFCEKLRKVHQLSQRFCKNYDQIMDIWKKEFEEKAGALSTVEEAKKFIISVNQRYHNNGLPSIYEDFDTYQGDRMYLLKILEEKEDKMCQEYEQEQESEIL